MFTKYFTMILTKATISSLMLFPINICGRISLQQIIVIFTIIVNNISNKNVGFLQQ
jgi:hypothetical protein